MSQRLEARARAWMAELELMLRRTVAPDANLDFCLVAGADGDYAIIAPVGPGGLIALPTHEHGDGSLHLRLSFTVAMDDQDEHIAVQTSVVGLCTNPETGRCPIRMEYDREKRGKQAAHIQVDAQSPELIAAYRAAGTTPKPLQKLHIPAGHRRFRATVEDFIEFLHQEGLIRNMQPSWQEHLQSSRKEWERKQLRAAVRNDLPTAAAELRRRGYAVIPIGILAARGRAIGGSASKIVDWVLRRMRPWR